MARRDPEIEKLMQKYDLKRDCARIFPNYLESFDLEWFVSDQETEDDAELRALNRLDDEQFRELVNGVWFYIFKGEIFKFNDSEVKRRFYRELKPSIDKSINKVEKIAMDNRKNSMIASAKKPLREYGIPFKEKSDADGEQDPSILVIADALLNEQITYESYKESIALGKSLNNVCADLLTEQADAEQGKTKDDLLKRAEQYRNAKEPTRARAKQKKSTPTEKQETEPSNQTPNDIINSESSEKQKNRLEPIKAKLKLLLGDKADVRKINECCLYLETDDHFKINSAIEKMDQKMRLNPTMDPYAIIEREIENINRE